MANIVYSVTQRIVKFEEDPLVNVMCSSLRSDIGAKEIHHKGKDLGDLANGGQIYIVGHGNYGTKIGAKGHDGEALGAKKLAKQLEVDGLPESPGETVWIFLYACATGTSWRSNYPLWKKNPYAMRFARALASSPKKFKNYCVVGYVGIMNVEGKHSLNYHLKDEDKRNFQGNNREDAPQIFFNVNNGKFNQVAGGKWKQYTSWKRRSWKPTVVSIKKR